MNFALHVTKTSSYISEHDEREAPIQYSLSFSVAWKWHQDISLNDQWEKNTPQQKSTTKKRMSYWIMEC